MTQSDKDLLLKDLCARLPYGVKFKYEDRPSVCEILSITPIYNNGNVVYFDRYVNEPKKCSIYDVKPYLFPLSSMTEEQLYELREMFGFEIEFRDELIELSTFHHNRLGYLEMDAMFEWFNRNHFDWRGLIPMGLAIDATNKNIY